MNFQIELFSNSFMFKKICFICFYFFIVKVSFSFSQIKAIKVKYNVIIGDNVDFQSNETLKPYYDNAILGSESLEFLLYSNYNETVFKLVNDLNANPLSVTFSGYIGEVYYKNDSDLVYQSVEDRLIGSYVVESKKKRLNWNLIDENKLINGHLCFKALGEETVINEKGTFKYIVTVWYCPTIPFSVGPLSYGGLPGLILELNRRNVVYGANSIEFNTFEDNLIVEPNIKDKKSEDEMLKFKMNFIENLKKVYGKQ